LHIFFDVCNPSLPWSPSSAHTYRFPLHCSLRCSLTWCSCCQLAEECAHSRFQIALPYLCPCYVVYQTVVWRLNLFLERTILSSIPWFFSRGFTTPQT
jgi:hypothetical protein